MIMPFPVMLQPVSLEFGWGRETMSLAYLIAFLFCAALFPIVGRMFDRWGSRRILLPGIVLFGLSMIGMSTLHGSVFQLLLLFSLVGMFGTLCSGVGYARALSATSRARRGLVLGLCLGAGAGIGSTLTPALTGAIVDHVGWRAAYVGLGLIPILVGLPMIYFFFHEPSSTIALRHSALTTRQLAQGSPSVAGHDLAEAFRTSTFWTMLAVIFLSTGVDGALRGHLVALLTDGGMSRQVATSGVSVVAMATAVGQLIAGVILDKINKPRVAVPFFAMNLAGILLLHYSSSTTTLFAGMVLLGFGSGAEYSILPYFLTRFFGLKAFGVLYGIVYTASFIGGGTGNWLMGRSYDYLGTYNLMLIMIQIAMVATVFLVATLRRYHYKVGELDTHNP
jgi:MFS family permease